MAKIGVKESILKVLMGHTDIATTHKYYIHITEQDIVDEVMIKVQDKEKIKVSDSLITNDRLEKLENMMKQLLLNNMINNPIELVGIAS